MTIGEQILALFDDPSSLWLHVFETQLDELTQRTFLALATLPEPVDLDELESIVLAQAATPVLVSLGPTLKALDDTFINIDVYRHWIRETKTSEQSDRAVSFRNPGLLDFAQALIEQQPLRLEAIEPFTRFEQVQEVVDLAMTVEASKPKFPKTRRYVDSNASHYLRAAVALYGADPCLLSGERGVSRLRTLVRIVLRLRGASDDTAFLEVRDLVSVLWSDLLDEPSDMEVADLLGLVGASDLLHEVLAKDPVAEYAQRVAGDDRPFESLAILEKLRVQQELALDEDDVRGDFEAYLKQRIDHLNEDDDHDSLQSELSQLEDLSYWISDDMYVDAQVAYEGRIAETAEEGGDDYRESERSIPSDGEQSREIDPNSDEYLGAMFSGLLTENPREPTG